MIDWLLRMDEVILKMDVVKERLKDKYDPNYYVYVFVENNELPIGKFDDEKWKYSYILNENNVNITDISKVAEVPKHLGRWDRAFKSVCYPDVWNPFLLVVYSKLKKDELEREIREWLLKENYRTTVFVQISPKVLERKIIGTILLTKDMLNKTKV